jgi:hypothetical protein
MQASGFLKTPVNNLTPVIAMVHITFFSLKPYESTNGVRCRWLKPVILATWEAEFRRIKVGGQTRQTVHKTLSPK